MSICLRWILGTAVLLSILAAPGRASAQPGGNHEGGSIRFNSGQNIQPVFQGWAKNADGSFTMHFGCFNRNYMEQLHVPVGAENTIQPGGPDRGQPTYFYPGFNRSVFTVAVPADWGKKELIWTLTVRGRTDRAVAWLQPEWEIDPTAGGEDDGEAGGRNAPPTIGVEPGSSLVTLPATLRLTATVTDDGLPPRAKPRRGGSSENPPAFRPEGALEFPVNVPQYERPRAPARARWWRHLRSGHQRGKGGWQGDDHRDLREAGRIRAPGARERHEVVDRARRRGHRKRSAVAVMSTTGAWPRPDHSVP